MFEQKDKKTVAKERLGRTSDGDLVPYEDVRATTLAYAPGEEISEDDLKDVKEKPKPADKSRSRASSK